VIKGECERREEVSVACHCEVRSGGGGRLTAVDAKMLLQVMLVLEGFSTLVAFELAVCGGVAERRRLQTEKKQKQS